MNELQGAYLTSWTEHEAERPRSAALDACIASIVAVAFHWIYWDRFLAPSSAGMFFYTAELILEGKVPYRDFFQIVPPLHPLKLAALIKLFGHSMRAIRLEALVERAALAAMVLFWLRRFATPTAALAATLLGIAIFASDPADPLASYHHDSIFFAVAAGLCATICFERSGRASRLPAFLAGIATAASLCTKHTTGVGVTAALGFLFLCLDRQQGRRWQSTLYFAAGWFVPVLLMASWLLTAGVGAEFFQSLFASSGAKGSGVSLYLRPFVQMWPLSIAAGVCLLLGSRLKDAAGREFAARWWIAGAALFACFLVLAAPCFPGDIRLSAPWLPATLILIGLFGSGWFGARLLLRMLTGEALDHRQRALLFVSVTGFSAAYMLGLSWAAYGPMALPCLAFIAAIGLDRASSYGRAAMVGTLGVTLALFAAQAQEKARLSFSWIGWDETTIGKPAVESAAPFAANLHITPETRAAFDGPTQLILERAKANNGSSPATLLVYPYMPMFYSSTGLHAPTYTFNHFLDVTPDWVVDRDIPVLKAAPPDFLIVQPDSADALGPLEAIFRSGNASRTRRIAAIIAEMTGSGSYKRIGKFDVPCLDCSAGPARAIEVWEKANSRSAQAGVASTY